MEETVYLTFLQSCSIFSKAEKINIGSWIFHFLFLCVHTITKFDIQNKVLDMPISAVKLMCIYINIFFLLSSGMSPPHRIAWDNVNNKAF